MTDKKYEYEFHNKRGMKPRFRTGDRFQVIKVIPLRANGITITYKVELERV